MDFYTVQEVAEVTGLRESSVRQKATRLGIGHKRHGRWFFYQDDLAKMSREKPGPRPVDRNDE